MSSAPPPALSKVEISTLYEDLPAEIRAEIRFWMLKLACILFGAVVIFSVALVIVVDPDGPHGARMGVAILLAGLALTTQCILLPVWLLATGLECWPAFLSRGRLFECFGLLPADLAPAALRARMRSWAYWSHGLSGLLLGWGMAAIGLLIWREVTGKPDMPIGAILSPGLVGYWVALRSWLIRSLLAQKRHGHEEA